MHVRSQQKIAKHQLDSERQIHSAMILAAGRGERMRPLTDKIPKPLVTILGRSMIERILERLVAVGVNEVVVNLFYHAPLLKAWLQKYAPPPNILFSHEEMRLDTGGGVAQALTLSASPLVAKPFYVINGDVLWLDNVIPALTRLAREWDEQKMEGLLLLAATVLVKGYNGYGDFTMDPLGKVQRRQEGEVAPFMFTGIQILHPRLFSETSKDAFSLNLLYDRAIKHGRLYGLRHDGGFWHVGTVSALQEAETDFATAYPENDFF